MRNATNLARASHTPDPTELVQLRRRIFGLEAALDAVGNLIPAQSLHDALERLLDHALARAQAERGSVLVTAPDQTLRILRARGLPQGVVRDTCVQPGEGIAGGVAKSGTPLLVTDIERDQRFSPRKGDCYCTHSFMSLPIRFHGAVRGVLNLSDKTNREAFTSQDLELIEFVTEYAVLALENALRFEQVLARAQGDSLTGLANRGHFWSTLRIELLRTIRYARELSLVMIDLDHFKRINDAHGHFVGDGVLREVAQVIAACSRACDLPARYGGEEFCVLLPETGAQGAVTFAERIRHTVEETFRGREGLQPVTVSAGVASYGAATRTPAELLCAADAQLYRAKAEGRNRVCAPSP